MFYFTVLQRPDLLVLNAQNNKEFHISSIEGAASEHKLNYLSNCKIGNTLLSEVSI